MRYQRSFVLQHLRHNQLTSSYVNNSVIAGYISAFSTVRPPPSRCLFQSSATLHPFCIRCAFRIYTGQDCPYAIRITVTVLPGPDFYCYYDDYHYYRDDNKDNDY